MCVYGKFCFKPVTDKNLFMKCGKSDWKQKQEYDTVVITLRAYTLQITFSESCFY